MILLTIVSATPKAPVRKPAMQWLNEQCKKHESEGWRAKFELAPIEATAQSPKRFGATLQIGEHRFSAEGQSREEAKRAAAKTALTELFEMDEELIETKRDEAAMKKRTLVDPETAGATVFEKSVAHATADW